MWRRQVESLTFAALRAALLMASFIILLRSLHSPSDYRMRYSNLSPTCHRSASSHHTTMIVCEISCTHLHTPSITVPHQVSMSSYIPAAGEGDAVEEAAALEGDTDALETRAEFETPAEAAEAEAAAAEEAKAHADAAEAEALAEAQEDEAVDAHAEQLAAAEEAAEAEK